MPGSDGRAADVLPLTGLAWPEVAPALGVPPPRTTRVNVVVFIVNVVNERNQQMERIPLPL